MDILITSILKWWKEHQYDEKRIGEEDWDNIYDEEPEFVKIAKKLAQKT